MDTTRKWILAVISIVTVSLAVTVTANFVPNTPLYTYRMEQASSQMNFLPTEINNFAYTTVTGSTLNYEITRYCYVNPLEEPTVPVTCPETCEETCSTCYSTCEGSTCEGTCYSTCPNTCATCEPTCEEPSCWNTCSSTCSTCKPCSTYRDCP